MKKVLIALIMLGTVLMVQAQNSFVVTYSDTLTNGDTIDYVVDGVNIEQGDFYISSHFQADSVSGSTGATAYLQYSNMASGDYWYSASTATIDGATTISYTEDVCYARRLRFRVISSGTQVTVVRWGLHATPR